MREFVKLVTLFSFAIPALISLVTRVKKTLGKTASVLIGWRLWVANIIVAEIAAYVWLYLVWLDGQRYHVSVVAIAAAFVALTASGLVDGLKLLRAKAAVPPSE